MRMMKTECMHSVNSVQCYAGRSEVEGGGGIRNLAQTMYVDLQYVICCLVRQFVQRTNERSDEYINGNMHYTLSTMLRLGNCDWGVRAWRARDGYQQTKSNNMHMEI